MSGLFYSAARRGFFLAELHGDTMPDDAVEVSAEEYAQLLEAQEGGREIRPGPNGRPEALAPLPPAPPEPIRRIAPLAFRRRLSPARRQAITAAAAAALAAGDPSLQTWLDDLAAARIADLDDPELRAGVQALMGAGLISPAEAADLLLDGTADEAA